MTDDEFPLYEEDEPFWLDGPHVNWGIAVLVIMFLLYLAYHLVRWAI